VRLWQQGSWSCVGAVSVTDGVRSLCSLGDGSLAALTEDFEMRCVRRDEAEHPSTRDSATPARRGSGGRPDGSSSRCSSRGGSDALRWTVASPRDAYDLSELSADLVNRNTCAAEAAAGRAGGAGAAAGASSSGGDCGSLVAVMGRLLSCTDDAEIGVLTPSGAPCVADDGTLLRLHGHRAAIQCLAAEAGGFFASSSADGCVKLWATGGAAGAFLA